MSAKLPPGITDWTPHPTTGKPRYLVRWREPSGKPRKRVFDRLTDARAHLAAVTADRHRGVYVDDRAGRERFEDFANRWAAGQPWKESTRQRWPHRLARLTWALGDGVRLGDVDKLTLEAARAELAKRYARSTVAGAMHVAKRILRDAHASGLIGRDPTIGVEAAPPRRQGDRDGAVTPDMVPSRTEALAILAGAPAAWRAAVALGLAGLRVGEVLGMRVDRLALDDRTVTVDAQAVELNGVGVILSTIKNERARTIRLPAVVALEVRRHLRAGHGGVWTDPDGVDHEMLFERNGLWRQNAFRAAGWAPALKAAGLPERRYKFHSMRHHCASALLAEGCPLPFVAGYLGDHQQTVLKVYSHWLPEDEGVPAAILDRVLAPEAAAPSPRHGAAASDA